MAKCKALTGSAVKGLTHWLRRDAELTAWVWSTGHLVPRAQRVKWFCV